jgi:hypothetical protein
MIAVEASNPKAKAHGLPKAREVGRIAIVTAMHGGALRAAGRAAPMIATGVGDDEQVIR